MCSQEWIEMFPAISLRKNDYGGIQRSAIPQIVIKGRCNINKAICSINVILQRIKHLYDSLMLSRCCSGRISLQEFFDSSSRYWQAFVYLSQEIRGRWTLSYARYRPHGPRGIPERRISCAHWGRRLETTTHGDVPLACRTRGPGTKYRCQSRWSVTSLTFLSLCLENSRMKSLSCVFTVK